MQRSYNLVRLARATQARHASGSSTVWYSKRWSEIVRAESNVENREDPPRAPLSDNHEVFDGESDFSNWVDKHEDVSFGQAVSGMGMAFASLYGIYLLSQRDRRTKTPTFTLREFPTYENDIPTLPSKR